MIDQLPLEDVPQEYWLYAGAAIVLFAIVAWRYRTGRRWFGRDTAATWQLLRRTAIPLLGRAARRLDPLVGEEVYARTTVGTDEHVATVTADLDQLLDDLAAAGYEPQPLASLATDWAGRTEAASWARYYGPKPWSGAPAWLSERQVHVRLFQIEQRRVAITAHEEANPWRPDQWADHYRAETMDVELGRRLAAEDLDVRLRAASDDTEP